MKLSHDTILYICGGVAVIGVISTSYLLLQSQDQKDSIASLHQERNVLQQEGNRKDAELANASTTIAELKNTLTDLQDDLEDLADDYRDEKDKNGDFEDQLKDLAGTLGDLDKLAKIDEELLQKYSKVYFLNENYVPSSIKQINDKYLQDKNSIGFFHGLALEHLEDMLKAAARDDQELQIVSAYRSFDEQTSLKGQHTQVYGTGANTFSADQGYSEHQLGTTVDLTTPTVGGTYTSFADSHAYEWLLDNAYKYGFILSYPEGNDFYIFEPWHWRFVGTDLAREIHRSNDNFYEMEQRNIDKHLLELFD